MERYSAVAAVHPHEEATNVPPQAYPFQRSLHSVRKAPAKPWKKPTAPQPPNPTRVYKVEPVNFRELVQKLTGASSRMPPAPARRLREAAPPPLELATPNPARGDINSYNNPAAAAAAAAPRATTPLSTAYRELMSEGLEKKSPHKFGDGFELSLSPSFLGWMLSPGTLSGF